MNNEQIESVMWHRDQLTKLLSDTDDLSKVLLEIDSILEKVKQKKRVVVRRGGKTFYREQLVGTEERDKETWQIPVEKFVDNYIKERNLHYKTSKETDMEYNLKVMNATNDAAGIHAKAIKTAIASGKNIPSKVLKDYPMYKK